jgi:2,4-dienoyl-CoA reductase-like NADH-dependent reductase (Old Yellow Enzyme family)
MPSLFDPLPIGGLSLRNRIGLSPMCQYSAVEGVANEWHEVHLGRYAAAGLGLIMVEATHVTRPGRITPGCLGLWTDEQGEALARIVRRIRRIDPEVKLGIQLAHAGRKGSADLPWKGGKPLKGDEAWQTVAPSALPHDEGWPVPHALDEGEMTAIRDAFVASARRALAAGFDVVELHGAHGYLIHTFVSPASNKRSDAYGGTREKRMRFPLEIAAAVRAVWPKDRAFGARISGNDYLGEEGMSVADAVAFARELKGLGAEFLDVSGGGILPSRMKVQVGPGYQVPSAERVKAEIGLPTFTVGMILDGRQANEIVATGKADAVMIGRALLNDPLWPWRAADALSATVFHPLPYWRGRKIGADPLQPMPKR